MLSELAPPAVGGLDDASLRQLLSLDAPLIQRIVVTAAQRIVPGLPSWWLRPAHDLALCAGLQLHRGSPSCFRRIWADSQLPFRALGVSTAGKANLLDFFPSDKACESLLALFVTAAKEHRK